MPTPTAMRSDLEFNIGIFLSIDCCVYVVGLHSTECCPYTYIYGFAGRPLPARKGRIIGGRIMGEASLFRVSLYSATDDSAKNSLGSWEDVWSKSYGKT